jgi:copper chaperone
MKKMDKERTVISVDGMSCMHCVKSIETAVRNLEGVAQVNVDLKAKTVAVSYDPAAVKLEEIKEVIEEQGYEVN